MNNISSQKFVSTTKHSPMIAPRWLFTSVPRAFAGCIARLRVGMAAIALLVIASTGFFAPGAHAATALYTTDFSPPQTTLSPLSFPNGSVDVSQDITGINEATGGQQAIIPFNALRSF